MNRFVRSKVDEKVPSDGGRRERRRYRPWQVLLAAMIGAVVASLASAVITAAMSDAAGEGAYVPVTPTRILDTRPSVQVGPFGSPWAAGETRDITVTGVGGVPMTGVSAVVVHVTTVSPTAGSFLTVFPKGEMLPLAASSNFVAGEIKNDTVIAKVGVGGQISIFNSAGTVDLVIDVVGYHTTTVESRVAELEALLAGVSREVVDGQDTLRLTDANFQVVSGSGSTYAVPNGRGNIIVGYNASIEDVRTGSHNLIVGDQHTYSSSGTVVFGSNNATTSSGATVTGGAGNTASGSDASVSGGIQNIASGSQASVSGGRLNEASESSSSVGGGWFNEATGFYSSVTGGQRNTASGFASAATGGEGNTASGDYSAVLGGGGSEFGQGNRATNLYSVVSGGRDNSARGIASSVSGGEENDVFGASGAISGGYRNSASGDRSSVSGGNDNAARGETSSVSGGKERLALGTDDWRAGGLFQND